MSLYVLCSYTMIDTCRLNIDAGIETDLKCKMGLPELIYM